jgi:hypothetical protein
MDQVFMAGNGFGLVGWLLLIAAPRWQWTARLVLSGWWSVALAVAYTALAVAFLPEAEGGFGSISAVRSLFAHDAVLTAGWFHYLAFDLFVGAAEVKQAQKDGISHIVMIPILIATSMLGPIGLLVFFVVRSVRLRRVANVID